MISKTALTNSPRPIPLTNSNENNSSLFAANTTTSTSLEFKSQESTIPTATQLTLDIAGDVGRGLITNTYLIKIGTQKGSGFLLKSGVIVTNLHVICDKDGKFDGSNLSQINAVSATNDILTFSSCRAIAGLDLILLWPTQNVTGGLEIDTISNVKVGESVYTWGHPLGYNGPNPLFSAGYLSGMSVNNDIKHLVINGAFNNGNSGGALFKNGSDKVIGIVVSKHAPLSAFYQSAIKSLSENKSGVVYTGTNNDGESVSFVESQVVAEILKEYTSLTQVMIGEAICAQELMRLLAASAKDLVKEAQSDLSSGDSLEKLNNAKKIVEQHFPTEIDFLANVSNLIKISA